MAENIIYYGPPGTGKTYFLQSKMSDYIDYAVSDEQIKNAYIKKTDKWILISMIMLQNHGKMSSISIQSKINSLNIRESINAISVLEDHNKDVSKIGLSRKPPCIFFETDDGCWYVDRIRIQQYMPSFFEEFLSDSKVDQRYAFVTFHQSFSYEDFIEGIRPQFDEQSKSLDYSPKAGIFKKICAIATTNREKEFAVFIDEINRGNISEIFGELISLIEVDKREGMANELSVTLPYSKETFVVPKNVNIYGTMNSADRSIGAIDIALRRRFKFVPMVPDSDIIDNELRMNGIDPHDVDGIDVIKLFDRMNERIEILIDRNHVLGQAMFMGIRNGDDIIDVMCNKVVPLLEEYFFKDLQKVQLVFNDLDESGELRENPIYGHTTISVDRNFDYVGDYLLEDKKHYAVNPEIDLGSIKHVYER